MFMRRYIFILLLVPLALAKRVESSAMGDTLQPGDWIWIFPMSPQKGDLVVFADPLADNRTIIRRVIAVEGEHVYYSSNGAPFVDGIPFKQSELSTTKERVVIQESLWIKNGDKSTQRSWRVIRSPKAYRSSQTPETQIQNGELFLMADDRDHEVDSRWWGPLKRSQITGVVKIRVGKANLWRSWLEYYP